MSSGEVEFNPIFRPTQKFISLSQTMKAELGKRAQEAQIWSLLDPAIAGAGFDLIEVELTTELGRAILRLYIDHLPVAAQPEESGDASGELSADESDSEGGVTVADTTLVSHLVGPLLDLEDPIDGPYLLEVSSPGFDRPIRRPDHFSRYAGSHVKIRTDHDVAGEKRRNFTGVLKGIHDGVVKIDVDGRLFELPHDSIVRARLDSRFEEESRR